MGRSWMGAVVRAVKSVPAVHGYSERGRTFHHVSELGDHAVVEIREWKDPRDGVRFFVEFRVVTGPASGGHCSYRASHGVAATV